MPGTPTVGTINGTPNVKRLSVGFIDYTGNIRSDSYTFPADTTDAELQAFVADLAGVSNASLFKAEVTFDYSGDADSSNALEEVWEDVGVNIVVLAKNVTDDRRNLFIPAPENSLFIEGTELVDPANVDLAALLTTWLATLPAGFTVRGMRLSQRSRRGRIQRI